MVDRGRLHCNSDRETRLRFAVVEGWEVASEAALGGCLG